MGTCVICGADVDGHVCASHEQDVCFEFEGSRPGQLVEGRYYRGTVDGYADFGVFVDVGDHVTGLLHTSEIDRRLESLGWEPGDTVFVQVKNVRDNGNVDLGWSIRQHPTEFRGQLIQTPEGDTLPEEEERAEEESDPVSSRAVTVGEDAESRAETADASAGTGRGGGGATSVGVEESPSADATDSASANEERSFERAAVEDLGDRVGDPVRIEGRVVEARQTSGPTIFEVRDETGVVDCAAFESAGVRAYPEIEEGAVVRLDGVVEERRGEVQVETEALDALDGEEAEAVERRLEEALAERARPDAVDLLADHEVVEGLAEELVLAAGRIRRAVFESRPVVIRHSATVDGYVAAAAIEHAVLPLVRTEHEAHDAEYHYVERRPLEDRVYGMGDALRDATRLLDANERHGEKTPLFVFANAGSTEDSRDALSLLSTYDAERIVIEGDRADDVADAADVFASADGAASTGALAANVAAHVDPDVRGDLEHLPAVSYWRDVPAEYRDLAADAGYDEEAVRTTREAIALEAFYHVYEDKRELVADLLFGERELAAHASEQFRDRVGTEVRTAEPHVERRSVEEATVAVLDLDRFTHPYEFPPAPLLLAELADEVEADALVGVDEDELLVWSEADVDVRAVGTSVDADVPGAGVEVRGGREGTIAFLAGERESVIDAAVEAIAEQIA